MHFDKKTTYILDGATGTEIQRRGFPTFLPLWSAQVLFDKPELLKQIYIDYIHAGADIITTNTFRTQRRTLAKVGKDADTLNINVLATQIAVQAKNAAKASRPIYIAGCMTTLEDCYHPDLTPPDDVLNIEHTEQAKILAATPIDFFLLETFNTVREAVAAARAVHATGKPFAVSFTTQADGTILNGDSWESAIQALEPFNPEAYLVNCVQPKTVTKALEQIKKYTNKPCGGYGNGDGQAADGEGWQFNDQDRAAEYLNHCREWKALGASIIGGCCGTNVDYTKLYSTIK